MMSGKHSAETHHAAKKRWLDSHDTGYHKVWAYVIYK